LLGAAALGVRGAVGATYNFAAPLYRRMLDAHSRGALERARADQATAGEMVRIILAECGRAGFKAAMSLAGVDCGPPRLPQVAATTDAVARVSRGVEG